ncbi:transporter [Polaribacter sp. IC073]|uniref:transporter n=1 Tax=Polaribacter sp. IC073 TaxID=2508540 RepID=UPI0011BEF30C|nr:transporter [Polaribacter sp. IC073]TXD46409.1 transporter [Polaribacter sp. IC073]
MKKLLFIALVLTATMASAQYTEYLASDRPGQALSSSTVGEKVFQVQTGIDFTESTSEFYPSSYFRYGFSERFEVNSGFVLSGDTFGGDLESFTVGARYNLSKKENKVQSSLQLSHDLGSSISSTQLIYILSSSFSEKLGYTVNLGLHLNDNLGFDNGIYIFNLSYAFNDKVGVFAETYGTFSNNSFQMNFDAGVYYLLNNNLQLDALIGKNEGFFGGAGVTWRIPTQKK